MKMYLAGGESLSLSRQKTLFAAGIHRRLFSFFVGETKIENMFKARDQWDGKPTEKKHFDLAHEISVLEEMEPGRTKDHAPINLSILDEPKPVIQPSLRKINRKKQTVCENCKHWSSPIGIYKRVWGFCDLKKEETRRTDSCDKLKKCQVLCQL